MKEKLLKTNGNNTHTPQKGVDKPSTEHRGEASKTICLVR